MGQIIGGAAKPKRCNLSKLSQLGTPAAGEYILVSSDNSMNAAGQGNFDAYVVGNGESAASALELKFFNDKLVKEILGVDGGRNLLPTLFDGALNAYLAKDNGKVIAYSSYVVTQPVSLAKGDTLIFTAGGSTALALCKITMSQVAVNDWTDYLANKYELTSTTPTFFTFVADEDCKVVLSGSANSITFASVYSSAEVVRIVSKSKDFAKSTTEYDGKYIQGSSGSAPYTTTLVDNSDCSVVRIPIDGAVFNTGEKIRYYCGNETSSFTGPCACFFDAANVCVNYASALRNANVYDFTIPSSTSYILASFMNNGCGRIEDEHGNILYQFIPSAQAKIVVGMGQVFDETDDENLFVKMKRLGNSVGDIPALKQSVEELETEMEVLDDLERETSPNCTADKSIYKTGGTHAPYTYAEIDAVGYIVSVKIPITGGNIYKWYSGFTTNSTTAMLLEFNAANECVNWWRSYDATDHIMNISTTRNSTYIITSFYVANGYDCRLEDNDGNVVYRPQAGGKELAIPASVVYDEESGKSVITLIDELSENGITQTSMTALFIGNTKNIAPLINGTETASTTYATMDSALLVPYREATLHFSMPTDIKAGVITCWAGTGTTTNNNWYADGDDFTFPSSAAVYRVYFCKDDGSEISAEDVNGMLASGDIRVTFDNFGSHIISDNSESEKYAKAIMYDLNVGRSVMGNNYVPNMPTFVHISDIHGDAERLRRCLDYADYIGASAVLLSGDMVNFNATNGMGFVDTIEDTHATPIYLCMGNHDAYGISSFQEQYNLIMKHSMLKNEVVTPAASAEQYPTYYYKDFAALKIRLITLNQWYMSGSDNYYSQTQADFFVNALLNTPQNYGVIVMSHSPEGKPTLIQGYDKFYQSVAPGGEAYATFNGEHFIKDILDAFIAKASINKTYTKDGHDSVTVSANFANVNTGVQFLFQATGHEHADWIGMTKNATQRQLMLNITTGASIYGRGVSQAEWAEDSDLPRGGKGSVQDAFNVYSIDREAGMIRIARIGSNVNNELKLRDFMIIPYVVSE